MRLLVRRLAWLVILAPPAFLFVAVQHGALTHPFSDYCTLIPLVDRLQHGTLSLADLVAPLNQNRPATWRALLLANARLTGWDVRSEYVYVVAALVAAFLVQAALLVRACAACSRERVLVLVAILSVVSFSPAAHNNHWWSMLLQFDMGHLFIVIAFALVSREGAGWRDHGLAALACWLAAYTVTNGLVAFVTCTAVAQIFAPSRRRLGGRTIFWLANTAVVALVYVPGLPDLDRGVPPLWRLAIFTLAYLGSPLASLVWFPYHSQFELPGGPTTARNAAAGLALLMVLAAAWTAILRRRDGSTSARAVAAFSIFAVGSAVLTSIGRSDFGGAGLANANASRFVLFGSYALYACLYAASLAGRSDRNPASLQYRLTGGVMTLVFLVCGTIAYVRSWTVYADARRFDRFLAIAYTSEGSDGPFDDLIYPVRGEIAGFKATLRALRLGPYRDAPESGALERLAKANLVDQFGINGLRAGRDGLILFAHPHSRFSIQLSRAVSVRFRYGVMANAMSATPPTDGVEFRILAPDLDSEAVVWSSVWRPVPGVESEQEVNVVLPRQDYSGALVFETLAAGRFENDWAYWTGLAVVRRP